VSLKAIFLLALALTCALTFGCAGGGTPNPDATPTPTPAPDIDRASLLHTWTIRSLSKDGTTVNCPGELPDGRASCGSGTVTFNADGTASASNGFRNTWTLTGNQLRQTTDTPGEVDTSTITRLTSSELVTQSTDGIMSRYTR
jgi:hypothetical protein